MNNEMPQKYIRHRNRLHADTHAVLKSIPNPFGSFEKATYVLYRGKSQRIVSYSFTTTCRNTEDCVEIMKAEFGRRGDEYGHRTNLCNIYKIQNRKKTLIFTDDDYRVQEKNLDIP